MDQVALHKERAFQLWFDAVSRAADIAAERRSRATISKCSTGSCVYPGTILSHSGLVCRHCYARDTEGHLFMARGGQGSNAGHDR